MSMEFRISTHCTYQDCNTCVEVASDDGNVAVRDTDGTVVTFTADAWNKFISSSPGR